VKAMDLASHQRALLGLIRTGALPAPADDPWLQRVATSPDLAEARRNIFLWRVYVLERSCVLSVALLRQRQALGHVLQAFIAGHNVSPFREFQPRAFLAFLATQDDALVAAVARFEQALAAVDEGDTTVHTVAWPVDPHPVLHALAHGLPLPAVLPPAPWTARVHHALHGRFVLQPG